MDKVKQMQDEATNGSIDVTEILEDAGRLDGPTGPSSGQCCTGVASSESGEQNTGIHSQRELEEQIARLEEERGILGPQLQDTIQKCSELEQRNAHLEAKLQEMSEQYQQAAVVIAQQSNQINQLNAELISYLRQIIANQEAQIVQLQPAAE